MLQTCSTQCWWSHHSNYCKIQSQNQIWWTHWQTKTLRLYERRFASWIDWLWYLVSNGWILRIKIVPCFCCVQEMLHLPNWFHWRIFTAVARNQTFTKLPKEWKELFPDLSEWFDVRLLLLKSVYGSVDGPRKWDDNLKEALFDFGFVQCHCANSIYLLMMNSLQATTMNYI